MSRNPPHKWHLFVENDAREALRSLSRSERQNVFRHLRELLNDDDPYLSPSVEMLQAKKFERAYRFRAGDYRGFFYVESGMITHLKHTYKGRLVLYDIRHRSRAY